MDIEKYKKNQKTSYLAERYEALLKEEKELLDMAKKDAGLKTMSDEELTAIKNEAAELLAQMEKITAAEKVEEEFPNEAVLEVRAGAGGEGAALFSPKLFLFFKN